MLITLIIVYTFDNTCTAIPPTLAPLAPREELAPVPDEEAGQVYGRVGCHCVPGVT